MKSDKKTCKVCGKEYKACHTQRMKSGSYRWQDVSCSPECGSVYLERILASRSNVENKDVADDKQSFFYDFNIDEEDLDEDIDEFEDEDEDE